MREVRRLPKRSFNGRAEIGDNRSAERIHKMKRISLAALAGLSMLLTVCPTVRDAAAQVLARHPDPNAPFAQRFEWAAAEAQKSGRAWIGFEISRTMPAGNNFVSSDGWSFHGQSNGRWGITLFEIIEGREPERSDESDQDKVRQAARYVLEDLGYSLPAAEMADRRVGVILGMDASKEADRWDLLWLGNIEMEFRHRGRTLFWLGETDATSSVPYLQSLLRPTVGEESRERLVEAIGVHSAPDIVVPVLEAIVRNDPAAEVREEAASWLGSQRSEAALDVLIWAAQNDAHEEVREEAVSAIERFRNERATRALIEVARKDEHREVREEAVEALGRRRSGEALEALKRIAFEDPHRDVQEEAVEAMTPFPENERNAALAAVASDHPSAAVREEAVEVLRMSTSAEAAVILATIVRNDASGDVQEEALEALLVLPDEKGVEALASIARSHPRSSIRAEAIELLESSRGPKAEAAVKKLRQ